MQQKKRHAKITKKQVNQNSKVNIQEIEKWKHRLLHHINISTDHTLLYSLLQSFIKQQQSTEFKLKVLETKLKWCILMSVAKHQACFATKLQGQNLATFSHSAVTPIAYLQCTPTKYALIMR